MNISTNIADNLELASIVKDIWAGSKPPPTFGPSVDICDNTVRHNYILFVEFVMIIS